MSRNHSLSFGGALQPSTFKRESPWHQGVMMALSSSEKEGNAACGRLLSRQRPLLDTKLLENACCDILTASWEPHRFNLCHPPERQGIKEAYQPRGKAERKPTSGEARQKGSLPAERQG